MSFWKSVLKDVINISIKNISYQKRGRKPGSIIENKEKYGPWPYYPYEGPIREDGNPHEGVGPRRRR